MDKNKPLLKIDPDEFETLCLERSKYKQLYLSREKRIAELEEMEKAFKATVRETLKTLRAYARKCAQSSIDTMHPVDTEKFVRSLISDIIKVHEEFREKI